MQSADQFDDRIDLRITDDVIKVFRNTAADIFGRIQCEEPFDLHVPALRRHLEKGLSDSSVTQ